MPDQTASRRERLRRRLKDEGVDGLLVSALTNVRYLTGFTGDSGSLLLTAGRSILISDGRFTTQIEQECPEVEAHIRPVGQPMPAGVADVVGGLGLKALAFESAILTVADHL